ncbi:ABC transporter ATP-binding protein [Polymorphum gilvum]|uniref:ABC transporter nucleotide binding ATPase protein n=1 Tax=Polymorphum gilvum (strain LMG 25793 / CGMCC 1.9160 / SL003B-26A1) TaxID=991905 RepID=F2IZ04_POLGS|nr:ABC transporter ATP-binding protein [Polymorphum gilvum]ADZ70619.1 ABC transporter nucleotide binding ATPase protein [Polymorphum gilvum SL003B-26A1]
MSAAKTSVSAQGADARRWGTRGTAGATIAAGLAFEHVSHAYGDLPTVHDLSLRIEPGEILCLLGHSGCGKTTLMRIAAGVEVQSAGRVLINDEEVAGPSCFVAPERRGVGLMFQDYALFPHLTNRENVMFGLTRLARSQALTVADQMLARVGLAAYADDYPHSLSGGEQQRVALARAIAPRPGVLLMDEPFSGLDRRLRDDVREETLAILRETRATCIIVTHDPEEAMRMGDKIALMRAGRLVQHGTAEDLYRRPADVFAARFFSEINQIDGVGTGAAVDCALGRLDDRRFSAGQRVDVCVRPQGVVLDPGGCGRAGRILSRRFIGVVDLLTVAVDGLERPLQVRVRDGERFAVGMDVGVGLDPRDVLIFAKSPTAD